MIIPNIPHKSVSVLKEDGTMSDTWHQFFSQLTDAHQQNLSEEGFVIPSQPASNIQLLNTAGNVSRIIYDKTNGVMKLNNNGTYKNIMTEP